MDIEARNARILALIDAKWPVEDIARDIGTSAATIYNVLRVYRPGRKRIRRANKTTKRTEIEKLLSEGKTADEIAESVGCTRAYVYQFTEDRPVKDPMIYHKVAGLLSSGYDITRTTFLSKAPRCYVRKVARELNLKRVHISKSELRYKITGLLQAGLAPYRVAYLCRTSHQYVYRVQKELAGKGVPS